MYFIVAPRFGALAGLGSALALAVFPSFVAVSRDNTLDSLLLLLMLAACGLALAAVDSGRTRTLLWSAVFVGLAFNTKSLAALLCVPGIVAGYLACAPGSVRRRIGQLALAGVVLAAVSFSWSVAVQLTPASQRPYVGSSVGNSEFNLAFGYNGVGRVGGQTGGPTVAGTSAVPGTCDVPVFGAAQLPYRCSPPHVAPKPCVRVSPTPPHRRYRDCDPVPFGGSPGPLRIFGVGLGDQGGWTVPLALIGLIAAIVFVLPRWRERRAAALFVLGGWFLIELLALDFSKGIVHPYYVSGLGPGLGAVAGIGAVAIAWLVRGQDRRRAMVGIALAVLAAITTVIVEFDLIRRYGTPVAWRIPLVIFSVLALAALAIWRARALWSVSALFLVLLFAPAVYSASVWDAPVDGTFPTAGPYNRAGWGGIDQSSGAVKVNKALARFLLSHHPTQRFTVLTESSDASSPLILLGLSAAALGGYNTTDPALSGDGLADLVAHHEARYVLLGGPYWDRGGNAATRAARLVCPLVPQGTWDPAQPDSTDFFLVDCAGRAAALRHPEQVAAAYRRAHPAA
jgi:4-amino-4-deoxy-L-arabinose transferase-like glycosyltransferase